jgi:hypothetical protein
MDGAVCEPGGKRTGKSQDLRSLPSPFTQGGFVRAAISAPNTGPHRLGDSWRRFSSLLGKKFQNARKPFGNTAR